MGSSGLTDDERTGVLDSTTVLRGGDLIVTVLTLGAGLRTGGGGAVTRLAFSARSTARNPKGSESGASLVGALVSSYS